MANSHQFDPSKGYVALPSDIMDIDMSPGAFRLLVELCRMANQAGECWPSLSQLGERIGRSKAAISGYISELRALELLETLNQRMANGYNYRLKYCVTFWQSWRAQLAAPKRSKTFQKTKRTVQPIERRVNSKNQNHKNQTLPAPVEQDSDKSKLVSVFSKWSQLSKNAPFPEFNAPIPPSLISETEKLLRVDAPNPIECEELQSALLSLWTALNVDVPKELLAAQVQNLSASKTTQAGLRSLQTTIQSQWKPHWKKPPTEGQFTELVALSQQQNRSEGMLKVLRLYLRRWEIQQNKLQPRSASLSLSEKHAA